MWINTKDKPIAKPANPPLMFFVEVDPKITRRKINVNINSATKAAVVLYSFKYPVPQPLDPNAHSPRVPPG